MVKNVEEIAEIRGNWVFVKNRRFKNGMECRRKES
jgi:hypothetical protein